VTGARIGVAAVVVAAGAACGRPHGDQRAGAMDAAATATAHDAATGDTLELALPTVAVGLKTAKREASTATTQVSLGSGEVIDIVERERRVVHEEVLEVTAGAPTRIAVHYATLERSQTVADQITGLPSKLVGNAYVVWIDGGGHRATTADGDDVSADELAELADDHPELGKVSMMAQLMASKPWRRGVRVDLTEHELAGLDRARGRDAGVSASAGHLTWVDLDGRIARFDVEIVVDKNDAHSQLRIAQQLVMKLDVDRVVQLETTATGTVTGELLVGPLAGKVDGRLEAVATFEYAQ
jgi:hypothetical protein